MFIFLGDMFASGDKVFAKLRGYPPWPARIENLLPSKFTTKKYQIIFYGTFETAVCREQDLYHYNENKEKLKKSAKSNNFSIALQQIEDDSFVFPIISHESHEKNNVKLSRSKNTSSFSSEKSFNHSKIYKTLKKSIKPKKVVAKKACLLQKGCKRSIVRKMSDMSSVEKIALWLKQQYDTAVKLKNYIESGEFLPGNLQHLVDDNKRSDSEILKEIKDKKSGWLQTEMDMLNLELDIKSALGLRKANTSKSLVYLDKLLNLNIDALMLKKHPHIVDTVKKLRQYVGNIKNWDYSEKERQKFDENASEIRKKSDLLYIKFQSLFEIPEGKTFLEVFSNSVSRFNEVINSRFAFDLCKAVSKTCKRNEIRQTCKKSRGKK